MNDYAGFLITWTTYGTWLSGDDHGWRKRKGGYQEPQPQFEAWCRERMTGDTVLLRPHDRKTVESACYEHCTVRGWELKAVNARTNHVHVVVIAEENPQTVRDQLKANCTRRLRTQPDPLIRNRTWTRGGDCEVLEDDDALQAAIEYVLEGQEKGELT